MKVEKKTKIMCYSLFCPFLMKQRRESWPSFRFKRKKQIISGHNFLSPPRKDLNGKISAP